MTNILDLELRGQWEEPPEKPKPWLKPLWLGLLVAFTYVGVRAAIQGAIPTERSAVLTDIDRVAIEREYKEFLLDLSRAGAGLTEGDAFRIRQMFFDKYAYPMDWDANLRREAWTGVARCLALLACLFLIRRYGDWRAWGWHLGASRAPLLLLMLAWSGIELRRLMEMASEPVPLTATYMLGIWATMIPVAVFEETCHRSVIFTSLKERMSPWRAAWVSSLIFAVWHIGAQPLSGWPVIFAFGMAACAALHRGLGLPWIMAVHWLVDAYPVLFITEGRYVVGPRGESGLWAGVAVVVLACVVLTWALVREEGEEPFPGAGFLTAVLGRARVFLYNLAIRAFSRKPHVEDH